MMLRLQLPMEISFLITTNRHKINIFKARTRIYVKKRYIGISLLVLIVCSITLLCLLKFNPFSASIEKSADSPITSEETSEKKSLTAMEALLLAYEETKKVSEEEPLLIDLRSTDDTDTVPTISDGADGKKEERVESSLWQRERKYLHCL